MSTGILKMTITKILNSYYKQSKLNSKTGKRSIGYYYTTDLGKLCIRHTNKTNVKIKEMYEILKDKYDLKLTNSCIIIVNNLQ